MPAPNNNRFIPLLQSNGLYFCVCMCLFLCMSVRARVCVSERKRLRERKDMLIFVCIITRARDGVGIAPIKSGLKFSDKP